MILKQTAIDIANAFTRWSLWRGGGGGGGSEVEVTPKISKGFNIANITVDGNPKELYSPYPWEWSTEEKIVGTMKDGKTVYEKDYYFSNRYFGNDTEFDLDLHNIQYCWIVDGFFTDGTNMYSLPLISGGSWTICALCKVYGQNASIRFRANDYYNAQPNREFYVKVRYTRF